MKNMDLFLEYIYLTSEQDVPHPEPLPEQPPHPNPMLASIKGGLDTVGTPQAAATGYNTAKALTSGLPGQLALAGTAGYIGYKALKKIKDRLRSG
jgi:hypothetical protein